MSTQKTSFSAKLAFFFILVVAGLFLPTTILLCGGLMPTLIAGIVDDRPVKTAWLTVGAMNFAGLVPAIFDLWHVGHTTQNAFDVLVQPKTIILAYSAAAAGWLLYFQIPRMVMSFLARRAAIRLRDIEKRRQELIRKWGPEVAQSDR